MKTYPKEDIQIGWVSKKCIHAGNCARQLSEVFKPKGDLGFIQKMDQENE